MALIFATGFPHSSLTVPSYGWTIIQVTSGAIEILTSSPRFSGGRWARFYHAGQAEYMRRPLPANYTTFFIQFGYKVNSYGSGGGIRPVALYDGTTRQVEILDTNGTLYIYNGSGGLVGTASKPLNGGVGTWHQIEWAVSIDNANGTTTLKVDGETLIGPLSSKDTQASANSYANYFDLGSSSASNNTDCGISDVIVMDDAQVNGLDICNSLLGPRMVKLCSPSAAGYYTQWSPSAGANWDCVEEIPQSESEYNSTDTVDEIDTFVVGDVAAGSTVDAVVCSIYAKNGLAGNTIRGVARSNSVDGYGPALNLGNSYAYAQSIIYEDPNSAGNKFTAAAFNAAEFGYQIRA